MIAGRNGPGGGWGGEGGGRRVEKEGDQVAFIHLLPRRLVGCRLRGSSWGRKHGKARDGKDAALVARGHA